MKYRLLSIPGCDRLDVPAAGSVNDLITAYGVGSEYDLPREAFGRDIIVTLPELQNVNPTHVCEYTYDGAFAAVYYIYGDVVTVKGSETQHRYQCELCGTLTAAANNAKLSIKRYHADRAAVPDSNAAGDLSSRTVEPIDSAYEMGKSSVHTLSPDTYSGYYLAVTWKKFPSNTFVIGNVPIMWPATVLFSTDPAGSTLPAWDDYCRNGLGADAENVYRVQLVPIDFVHNVYDYGVFTLVWESGSHEYAMVGRVLRSILPTYSFSRTYADPGVYPDYVKSFGAVGWELWHKGECLAKIDGYDPNNPRSWTRALTVQVGVAVNGGLNPYALIKVNGAVIGKVSLGLPEIQTAADALTIWWDGAKSQILTSAGLAVAGSLISGAASGGATIPASLASIVATGAGVVNQAVQTSRQSALVGSGSQSIYALEPTPPYLQVYELAYEDADIRRRNKYFALNGYSCSVEYNSLPPTQERSHYAYLLGTGRVQIKGSDLVNCPITQRELQEAVDEELAAGVRFWYTMAAGTDPLTAPNPTLSQRELEELRGTVE